MMAAMLFVGCKESSNEIILLIDKKTTIEGNPYSETGAKITGFVEVLAENYKFQRDTIKNVVFLKLDDGPITGSFSCGCGIGDGLGGCKVTTGPFSISCGETVCKTCYMITTIPQEAYLKLRFK